MKEIRLTQGKIALVDDEDFERVNQFNWSAQKGKNTYYAKRNYYKNGVYKTETIQEFIMGTKRADHIDHNGLNCQRHNLRNCTHQQNCMNTRPHKNSTSQYKGVYKHRLLNKWVSQISYNCNAIYLGLYITEIDAAIAYDNKARELFGEFAYLNFPEINRIITTRYINNTIFVPIILNNTTQTMTLRKHYKSLKGYEKALFIERCLTECMVERSALDSWVSNDTNTAHRTPNKLRKKILSEISGIPESELFPETCNCKSEHSPEAKYSGFCNYCLKLIKSEL